jgi:hypothetical protein
LTPLKEVPIATPPFGTVYHDCTFPATAVELSCDVPPGQIAAGVAVTGFGVGETGLTVTVTGTRGVEGQVVTAAQETII